MDPYCEWKETICMNYDIFLDENIISGEWIRMFEINQYAFSKANHKLFNLLTVNNV